MAGGFGLVIGILDLISGMRGAGWGTGIVGLVNLVFGLILLVGYPLAPPLVLVSVVVWAIGGGLVELVFALRLRFA